MAEMKQFETFQFVDYHFDEASHTASFWYAFDDELKFEEKVEFTIGQRGYDTEELDAALFLAWVLAGTSYYKCFPKVAKVAAPFRLDEFEAGFFTRVYQEGMSQFAFENKLTRRDLINFNKSEDGPDFNRNAPEIQKAAEPFLALQSGGKDSLLTAQLLKKMGSNFVPAYMQYSETHPKLLDKLGTLTQYKRYIDRDGLAKAKEVGALNGHVPITYIVSAYALIQSILTGEKTVLTSIGHEGDEAHEHIDDLAVNHQWAKTWPSEQAFAEYVRRYISPDIAIGSMLRPLTELAIAELFVAHCWQDFGHEFSSCNLANYKQGQGNETLKWCGECPKCANNFLLFAPFVEPDDLKSLFGGQDLFKKEMLLETWKGLLDIDGVMKPFECVGETTELRKAYRMAVEKWGRETYSLPFEVPQSDFDYKKRFDAQPWAATLLNKALA
jgi:UDP-N-acetyl-alpha-D-muramoyl-L-alanyl-L-glutamate epimerase